MVGMEQALQDWLNQVSYLSNLSIDEQTKITSAGAKVYKDELEQATREKHYSKHDDKVYGHMADGIVIQKSNVDGMKIGTSTVGWPNSFHATNARRLNDGTKKYTADHFVTNVQQSQDVLQKVLLAEKAAYDKIIGKRG